MIKGSQSRLKNTLFSMMTGMLSYFIVVILGFVGRSIFVRYLNVELLGVNSLFSSILQVFSLAELGFATAVGVALYKPLSEKDEKTIAAIMKMYAKVYMIIGIIVLIMGLLVLPFLQYFIKDFDTVTIALKELRIYFLLFLASSVASYFFAYKKTLLISDQKKYIVNANMTIFSIVSRIAQILIVIFLKNFVLYLIVNVVSVYLENIISSIIVDKVYPYLKNYKDAKLSKLEKKTIFSNIGALAVSKMSSVLTSGIVAIIISRVVGLRESGMYSNYLLVTTSLISVISVIFEAVTASAGNFTATETKEKQKQLFAKILYVSSFLATMVFVGLFTLFDDFISLWLSPEMLLPKSVSLVMAINLYFWCMRQTTWVLYNACGLYKYYFYRSFAEIAVFGVLAYFGARYWSVTGIISAQILAVIIVQFWVEVLVVSKYALHEKQIYYYKLLFRYLLLTVISSALSWCACAYFPVSGILGFVLKMIFVIVIVCLVYIITTHRSDEYKYFKGITKGLLRIRSKGKIGKE